ncbi:peptidoglycan DD-metalloendopeptidase family protein [Phytoactinopolyspora alkaliphila]|uniref:Peptidoglycan DD-metalloendopeptidase family protein n=1 Tax=Phytoactinopolyspora alkaliphila TaxID=1783498 RepID=A0A6N9YPQ5_9ACTN|nr:peptidoglycan DD-metalloendopeptidase family protein [Phytoactinopolyspora alkaliphila]NED96954.1 peptidoglycan DD-metalloendopeptidase family protein [Phytoactinopolyspora alkaliphila]
MTSITTVRTRSTPTPTACWHLRRPAGRAVVAVLAVIAALVPHTSGIAANAETERPPGSRPAGWIVPVGSPGEPPDVVRGFDPPDKRWLSGHRGVDVRAPAGSEVRAPAAGRVTYAGLLAGRGVVVVNHGTVRTTYEPVEASVTVGTDVVAGQPLGLLSGVGGHCVPAACLHWGAIEGDVYLNPLSFLGAAQVRLLPLRERTLTEERPPVVPDPPTGPPPDIDATLAWPVANPRITSPYGTRVHPITGERRLHDGTDLAAACGTPIRAPASGRVTAVGMRGPYGLQVAVDHGTLGSVALETSASHLSRPAVRQGQRVDAGTVIGWSGTTGLSTGCHLHFMVHANGHVTDPVQWLPRTGRGDLDGRHTRIAGGVVPRARDASASKSG